MLVITFLPRSKRLLISWLQSPSAVILDPQKIKSDTVSTVSPSISHEMMGLDAMIFVFWREKHIISSFTYLNIWTEYLSSWTILDLKIQNKKPVSPQSYSPLKLSTLFSLYYQTFGENGRYWGLCSLRSTYCLTPPHLTSGSRLINLLSNWSVIQKTIIELTPWVMTFPLSDLHK